MLRPITQSQSDAWDAQPGTDVFGFPWSSWKRLIATDHQAALIAAQAQLMRTEQEDHMRKQKNKLRRPKSAGVTSTRQLELGL